MGGLARYMPITFWTTTIAGLALVGVFPLSGFWSKDEILADTWSERPVIFWAAMAGVFLTALYVGRMLFLTFGGRYRGGETSEHGAHAGEPRESPWVMASPMLVLAALSVTAGFVNVGGGLSDFLTGALPEGAEELEAEGGFEFGIAAGSVALGLAGLFLAWLVYGARVFSPNTIRSAFRPLHTLLEKKYYLDYLYEEVIVRRGVLWGVARGLDLWDRYVVDGIVNGSAMLARLGGDRLRYIQTGQTQLYGAAIFLGVVAAILGILLANP